MNLFKAATLITFWLALSELVAAGQSDTSLSSLQRKDVVVVDRQVVIHLRRSKTDQMGKDQIIVSG